MTQKEFITRKENLLLEIENFIKSHNLNDYELNMLKDLATIILATDYKNRIEREGMLSYFIRDSFDVKNFIVKDFILFDKRLI